MRHEGRWHCLQTPWHGHYAINGHNIELIFHWRHPANWLSPNTLRYDQRLEAWLSDSVLTMAARRVFEAWLMGHPQIEQLSSLTVTA